MIVSIDSKEGLGNLPHWPRESKAGNMNGHEPSIPKISEIIG